MNVNQILPAIIGSRIEDVRQKLKKIYGLVDWVQIDVVDGLFAMPATWPYRRNQNVSELKDLKKEFPAIRFELHLMIENPETSFEDWISSGADRLLIHYESTPKAQELISKGRSVRISSSKHGREKVLRSPVEMGLVLSLDTSPEVLENFAHTLKFIQVMSIAKIGSYGAIFSDSIYSKIEYLRKKFPNVIISVDGGVSLENAKQLFAAGANNLVVGSALWKSVDLKNTISLFKKNK